jgi:GAF domain-containing protein
VLGQVIEISALHRSGREFPIELSISPAARNGSKALILAFIRDISDERRAQKLREAQAAITELLDRGPSLEDAAAAMLDVLGDKLGWNAGALWLRDGRAQAMRCVEFWEAAPGKYRDLERTDREAVIGPGRDLVGQAWAEGDGVWVEDVLHQHDMPRALPALRGGLHTVVAIPILESGQVRGVIELLSEEVRPQEADVLNALYDFGRRLGRLSTGAGLERRGFFRRLLG